MPPTLPPPLWAELYYDGAWNAVTDDLRATTSQVTITRGLSSESASAAEPTTCECDLDSRTSKYAPRNPASALYGLIGRNTPFRVGYTAGSPWAELPGGLTYSSLFVNDDPALDVTGDFDLRIDVALEDWAESQMLALRYVPSADESWALEIVDGVLTFLWSPDGTFASRIVETATETLKAYNGQRLALRVTLDVDNGAGGYELRFYTGRTVDDTEWNLLGDPVTGGATTAVFAGSGYMELGAGFSFNALPSGGVLNRMRGKAFALQLRDGIGGTVNVDMSTASATAGGTTFVDDTGLTWSRGGSSVLTNKHVRMVGEVPAWPPTRDLSGNDNYVSISPTGITRRMDAGNKPQDSALLRYIRAQQPLECWPLTDSSEAISGRALYGSQDMILDLDTGTARPQWGKGTLADWIEPTVLLPAGSDGKLRGQTVRASGAATGWSVDFFYAGKQDLDVTIADYGELTDASPRVGWTIGLDVSADTITLFVASVGETISASTLQATINDAGVFDGKLHHVRLTTSVSGTDALWEVFVDGVSQASGTAVTYASKAVYFTRLGWFYSAVTQDLPTVGYVTYWGSSGAPSAADMWSAATGFQGELAGARITRLAGEAGYTASVAGDVVYQQPMGVQGRKTLLELLNESSRTNFGYLLDRRDGLEVIHRGQSTLWNQQPALTLDYTSGLISPPFRPVDDDKLTENDIEVKREYGNVPARQVLEDGALSVLAPEQGGVGRYDNSYTYSLYTDAQAEHVAYMRLHLGTYDGVRYTRITLNLANERVYALLDDILRVDAGDLIRLTSLPADHGPDDVDVLVQGYTEDAGPDGWTITFNCVPARPWTTGLASQTPDAVAEDFEDASLAITVTDGGDLPWQRTNAHFNTGAWSFRSGAITNNQTSVATVDVPSGATWLTFWYRTSSEESGPGFEGDRLTVDVDATQVLRAQGTVDWTQFATDVTGATSVAFTYSKDNSAGAGEDAVYIDDVRFTIPGPLTSEDRADTGGCELTAALDATTTSVPVLTTGAARWVDSATYPDEFPFNVRTGGEVMQVTACTGTTLSQTFTVVRSINGVQKSHSSGQAIGLARPVYAAL
ncbi:hypothetical protein [Streptomyces sp. bgisy154]|uniref:hypothetical protein n=1 Tax=Streptomyces sp. bgisy154 TaxID=3413794 RepID=UPI003D757C10